MKPPKQKPSTESRAALDVQTLPLASLKPHPRNPRVHPEPGSPEWEVICASLKADYFDPIVWNKRNGLLVSGHLRTKALLHIGKTHADCVVVDYDESTHIARMIAANKSIGKDESTMLKDLLQELDTGAVDMATTGYAEQELARLMEQVHQGENDPSEEWKGMPEFDNPPKGFAQVVVHFKSMDDMMAFSELIGQQINESTRSIWYPQPQNIQST